MLDQFKIKLKSILTTELPGHSAHQKVMRQRAAVGQENRIPSNARNSSVLILIYPKENQLYTVFILRPSYSGVHSNQIGFPGGKVEKEDASLEHTALREAKEELNIEADKVEIIGKITPIYVPPSNFIVNPFIAIQREQPTFIPEEKEVAEILECPLENILGEDKLIDAIVRANKQELNVKGFYLEEKVIWGATAMIVKEFTEILEDFKLPSG